MPDANLLCGTKESCTHGMNTSVTSSFLRPFKANPHREGNTRPRKNKKKKKRQPSTRAELQSSLHHGDSFLHLVNFRNEERDKNRTLLIRTRKSFEQLNCRLDFFLLSNIHRDRSRKIAIRLKIFLNLIFNEYYRVLRKKLENAFYFN